MTDSRGSCPRASERGAIRRRAGLTAMALFLLALAGCDKKAPASATPEAARPALIQEVGAADAAAKPRFPGRLRAAKRAELSFNVPGFVTEFGLTEGSRVRAGQVVARLDDAVFKARVNAAQSEFDRAKTDLERYQRLWETEFAVARSEVDDRRSRLEAARTNLAAAQQDLSDTVIKAPFAGVVTRRRLETFASVQAKQPIAELQDLDSLEVVIHVPQRLLRNEGSRAEALAFFEEREDLPVPVVLKSYATEADPTDTDLRGRADAEIAPAGPDAAARHVGDGAAVCRKVRARRWGVVDSADRHFRATQRAASSSGSSARMAWSRAATSCREKSAAAM